MRPLRRCIIRGYESAGLLAAVAESVFSVTEQDRRV
jgi:hypothetical protein